MKSMLQKESKNKNSNGATIVITTHDCNEKNMFLALSKINKMKFIKKKTIYYRIENFTDQIIDIVSRISFPIIGKQ